MSDYDYDPKAGKGAFIRLKSKDESVVVRIASAPYREPVVWKEGVMRPLDPQETAKLRPQQWAGLMRDPDYTISEQFHWIVIDRTDGQARIFSGAPSVYKAIKGFAQNSHWGDPKTYDIQITRTERPGSYYEVTALPDKEPLSKKELDLVAQVDMADKKPNARLISDKQIDDIEDWANQQAGSPVGQSGYEKAKAAAGKLKHEPEPEEEAGDDEVITDIGDDPINLDDIPF